MRDMPSDLCRDVGIEPRREGSVSLPRLGEERWAESPTIFCHSVAWSAQETAGLSAPCVPVVSGNDVAQGGIFFFFEP